MTHVRSRSLVMVAALAALGSGCHRKDPMAGTYAGTATVRLTRLEAAASDHPAINVVEFAEADRLLVERLDRVHFKFRAGGCVFHARLADPRTVRIDPDQRCGVAPRGVAPIVLADVTGQAVFAGDAVDFTWSGHGRDSAQMVRSFHGVRGR